MKPVLFILAAGMGSRYGGLKQLDSVGPSGETIMDYSVYDAIRAGFGKVVFVIRRSFAEDFHHRVVEKYADHIPVEVVFQELDSLPSGFTPPPGREKPWGTNHAVLMGKEVIREPFAVINADDFYGYSSFVVMAGYLQAMYSRQNDYCMVGYRVGNTLSESGSVARGVCQTDVDGYLSGVVERTDIACIDGQIRYTDEAGRQVTIPPSTPVSMNMWGFTPDYFHHSEVFFREFLQKNMENPKSEYFIPLMVNRLITTGTARVKVLDTTAQWFGVTYAADRPGVVNKLLALVESGEYPPRLF